MKRSVSRVLGELGYKYKHEGTNVIFHAFTEKDGKRYSKIYNVPDNSTIIVNDSKEYYVDGEVFGCNVQISYAIPKRMIGMTAADVIEERKRSCLFGILQRLLIDGLSATDLIRCKVEEYEGEVLVRMGVKAEKC